MPHVEAKEIDAESVQDAFEASVTAAYETHPDKGMSFGPRQVHINRDGFDWETQSFLFVFGDVSPTYVLAYGCVEDALERAAETLKEIAPGAFVTLDVAADATEAQIADAEIDTTYTESGYLASWLWDIGGENMSPAEVLAFVRREF